MFKGGFPAWSVMGESNASLMTCEPLVYRPQWGAHGLAKQSLSVTFMAQAAIYISAKDAGALLLELNGQTLAPLGPPGQPANLTLTRSNLKPASGGSD